MTIYQFPTAHTTGLPVDDHDRHAGPYSIDPRDREMFDETHIDVQDDSRDLPVALPIRAGFVYGAPTIELGRYSLTDRDARQLAQALTDYASRFHTVA